MTLLTLRKHWLTVVIFLLFIIINTVRYASAPGDDLSSTYMACRLLAYGQDNHLYSFAPTDFHIVNDPVWAYTARQSLFSGFLHPYVYAPLWAFALQPFCGVLLFPAFKTLFLILDFIALAATVWLALSMWAKSWLGNPIVLVTLLAAFSLSAPFDYMGFLCQPHAIFLCATILAVFLADRQRYTWAGLILAIAAAVKITPGVFALYWLISKQWKATAGFCLWMLALAGISVGLLGLPINIEYLDNLRRVSHTLLIAYNNQSFAAWDSGLRYPIREIFNWHTHPMTRLLVFTGYGLTAATGIFLAVIYALQPKRIHIYHPFGVSALLVAATLFANIAWSHYFIILIVPLVVMIADAVESREYGWLIPAAIVIALNFPPLSLDQAFPTLTSFTIIRSQFFSGALCLITLLTKLAVLSNRHIYLPLYEATSCGGIQTSPGGSPV